jgi:hypothetical protein
VLRLDYHLASVAKALLYASALFSDDVSVPRWLPRFGCTRDGLLAGVPRVSGSERGHAVAIMPSYEHIWPLYFTGETHRHSVRILLVLIPSVLEGSSAQAVTARCFVGNPPLGTDAPPESRGIEDARVIPWRKGRVCQTNLVSGLTLTVAGQRQQP